MLTNRIRIIVAIITFIISLSFIIEGHYIIGSIILLLVGGLLAFDYFKNGTVFLAMRSLQAQDNDKTEKLLAEIKNPQWLGKFQRSYYYLLNGVLNMQKNNYQIAEGHLKNALDLGVRAEEQAMVYMQLANIRLMKRDMRGGRMYLDKAKKSEKTPEALKSQVSLMDKELKKHGY